MTWRVIEGDCVQVMRGMAAESVDSVVCDPPYDLLTASRNGSRRVNNDPERPFGRHAGGFMGMAWDSTGVAFDSATWQAAYRVAKPGAYLIAFGGPRTWHRLVCAIEDAGWEIRDSLCWMFGSGFPKAKSCLKPAWEPIVLARKAGRTVAPLNIDGCRIPHRSEADRQAAYPQGRPTSKVRHVGATPDAGRDERRRDFEPSANRRYAEIGSTDFALPGPRGGDQLGRWPANVVLDEGAAALLDEQSGMLSPGHHPAKRNGDSMWSGDGGGLNGNLGSDTYLESGGASRFYYVAKASRSERGEGNNHPTVKPLALMRWLVRLVTPPAGLVLDPFAGSFTAGLAALREGFDFVGIERDTDYCAIGRRRLAHAAGGDLPYEGRL